MLGVLTNGDVNAVLIEDRCRVDFADAFRGGVLEFLPLRRVAIVFPGNLKISRIAFLHRLCVEGVAVAVAAAEENQFPAVHHAHRRRAPLPMENVRTDVSVVLGDEFTGLLIERDEAG